MNEDLKTKVILAGVFETSGGGSFDDFMHSMDELWELTMACEMEPQDSFYQQMEKCSTALYLGIGKVAEIKQAANEKEATLVILNDTLSPIQIRNLQKELGIEVMDRTALILEIFRSRARTREAKLQVELASLNYLKPRLIGMWEKQNRQGGASGALSSKGEGETQLEIDRRTIDHRLAEMRRELKVVERERETQRKKRQASGIPLVALVGYTNAGKSTIMNAFVEKYSTGDKKVFEANMLFATLDTTVRRMETGKGLDFLLSDTVGFIQKLPTGLVEAFKSTLEEVKEADLILQVVDYSDERYRDHINTTISTISDLGAGHVPMITVYNKCDIKGGLYPRLGGASRKADSENENDAGSIFISARDDESIELLREVILDAVYGKETEKEVLIPYNDGAKLAKLLGTGEVLRQDYTPEGTYLKIRAREKLL